MSLFEDRFTSYGGREGVLVFESSIRCPTWERFCLYLLFPVLLKKLNR